MKDNEYGSRTAQSFIFNNWKRKGWGELGGGAELGVILYISPPFWEPRFVVNFLVRCRSAGIGRGRGCGTLAEAEGGVHWGPVGRGKGGAG